MKYLDYELSGDSMRVDVNNLSKPLIELVKHKVLNMSKRSYDFLIIEIYKNNINFFQMVRNGGFSNQYFIEFQTEQNGEKKQYSKCVKVKEIFEYIELICIKNEIPDIRTWHDISYIFEHKKNDSIKELKKHKREISYYNYLGKTSIDQSLYSRYLKILKESTINYVDNICDDFLQKLVYEYIDKKKFKEIVELEKLNYCNSLLLETLADIYFKGYIANPDYKKAYRYYYNSMQRGNLKAYLKIAIMYKNGVYVRKNYRKYEKIINNIYQEIEGKRELLRGMSEILLEKSYIEKEKGNEEHYMKLVRNAKFLVEKEMSLMYKVNDSFKIVMDEYLKFNEINQYSNCLMDIPYLLKKPGTLKLVIQGEEIEIKSFYDNDKLIVKYIDNYFEGVFDFFYNAIYNNRYLSSYVNKIDYFIYYQE